MLGSRIPATGSGEAAEIYCIVRSRPPQAYLQHHSGGFSSMHRAIEDSLHLAYEGLIAETDWRV